MEQILHNCLMGLNGSMNIVIITGGIGPEREVSINSAEFLATQLTFAYHKTFLYPEEFEYFLSQSEHFDIVIPMIHGAAGEDGSLQKKLKEKYINYLFSDSEIHKKCFHKEICKNLVSELGYNIPKTYNLESENISFPIIAKPQESGSSDHLYYIEDRQQLDSFNIDKNFILEEFVTGREFTVGVIEYNNMDIPLPVMEIRKNGKIFNQEEKYSAIAADIEIFMEASENALEEKLKDITLNIHKKLGIKNLSRTDFIVTEDNQIYFLEINTIPGCTQTSFIPKMIKKEGISFNELLAYWCKKELE